MSIDSCKSLQESREPTVPPPQTHCAVFTTKGIPEINNGRTTDLTNLFRSVGRTKVHHVGPCAAAVNAVMLWGAAVALVITVVAMATTEWATGKIVDVGPLHIGLWRVCIGSVCVDVLSGTDIPGKYYRLCDEMTVIFTGLNYFTRFYIL